MTLRPPDLPRLIIQHLRQVLLPRENDYVLAALVVMTSYVQAVFDAVPLVLIVGPPGSGKTELARLMADVGANGVVITGQTSAATAARLIDETGGLVAFDDLEEVRQRSGSAEASNLEQFLKVSYKKETALKQWTDTKGMRVQTLNFFGVKVITNTQGTGEILGSRMFTIRTVRLKDLATGTGPRGLPPKAFRSSGTTSTSGPWKTPQPPPALPGEVLWQGRPPGGNRRPVAHHRPPLGGSRPPFPPGGSPPAAGGRTGGHAHGCGDSGGGPKGTDPPGVLLPRGPGARHHGGQKAGWG